MARKDDLDRPLFTRMRTQFETADAETLLHSPSEDLLDFIRKSPLVYGFWADFKRLAKAAERSTPIEPTAALLARLDTADLPAYSPSLPISPLQEKLAGFSRMDSDGTYAYVVNSSWRAAGAHIVDLSNPALPEIVAEIKQNGSVDVAVSGTKLYLLMQASWNVKGRLACYDISDPTQPKPESGIEIADAVRVVASGSQIAVLTTENRRPGLQLIDASAPGQLRLLGHLALPSPLTLQVVGSTAYIINSSQRRRGDDTLVIADLSDPMNPKQLREIAVPATTDLAIQGRYAYLACSKGRNTAPNSQTGLVVVDLAPPDFAQARRVALLAMGNVASLAVSGGYAYVSVGRAHYVDRNAGGVRIVDISDPLHPRLNGTYTADEVATIQVVNGVVCIGEDAQWTSHFRILDVSEPGRPLLLGAAPRRETLAYMKRRGRRLLRTLALRDPETYVRTAAAVLLETGKSQPELDRRTQWISMDLLYGTGTRTEQQAHGRGSYSLLLPGLSLRTRDERFPELWDRYPELAEPLYTTPNLPWQTAETACKILRAANTPLPTLNDKMLTRFLASGSPLLRSVASRQVAATLATGKSVAADVAAETYYRATRRQRTVIDGYFGLQKSDARWNLAFATRLYQLASSAVQGVVLPRKATLAFALLLSRFPAIFNRDIAPASLVALYAAGRPDFTAKALKVLATVLPAQLPEWLRALKLLPPEPREVAVQAILRGTADKDILPRAVAALVNDPDDWIRETGWRVLAHSQTALAPIASVWSDLLDSSAPTPALLTALASPDALALFSRCNFDSHIIAARLEAHPYLIPLLPMSALEKVVAVLPPTAVIRLASEATDEQWPEMRRAILAGPLQPDSRAAFWREAFAAIGATGNTVLTARLLNDAALRTAFLQSADITEFLRSANPVFGPILGAWSTTHADLLRRDSAELLQIATHPLPDIRIVGLERVRQIGMSLPFALRLLESELPPAAALGKTFFEAIPPDEGRRTEAITALCDSPKPSVRAYGRDYLKAHPEMMAAGDMLERLSENPDPETQAFVAGQLMAQANAAQPGAPLQTAAFDRAVLRARDKGRRAKELVKTRLDRQPTADIPLLLEMARSRTPRDADWALGQLAKLALDGVEIPGFTLDGVAGG
jgi:hypothetical protein